eukprot:13554893-Alexandrium_andersonii.AAC.1
MPAHRNVHGGRSARGGKCRGDAVDDSLTHDCKKECALCGAVRMPEQHCSPDRYPSEMRSESDARAAQT